MKFDRSVILAFIVFYLVIGSVGAQETDEPYINPPVTYDYSGDSDSTTDAVYNFSPDDEAVYIKVIMFHSTGTETHRIEVYNPAGELYFYEDFGVGDASGWTGDFGDYQIVSRIPIRDTPAAEMLGIWDIVVYFQVGESVAGPDSYEIKHLHEFHIAHRDPGRREVWIEEITHEEEVEPGATVSVDLKVGWIFDSTTTLMPGIFNPETEEYEDETQDSVGSEASKTYTMELDAPMEPGNHSYRAEVLYTLDEEWILDDDASASFWVTVVSEDTGDGSDEGTGDGSGEGTGDGGDGGGDGDDGGSIGELFERIGIPGFPSTAIMLGVLAAYLWMNHQKRNHPFFT